MAVVAADPDQRLPVLAAVEKEGYRAVLWTDFEQILAALPGPPPELIVAGLAPPDLEGWRLCGRLRSLQHPEWKRIPVLLFSASLADDDACRVTAQLGGNGLVRFPFDDRQFAKHVRGLLEGAAGEDGVLGLEGFGDVSHQAKEHLAALIESTEDIIWSVDLNYRLLTFNRVLYEAFERSFGVRPAVGMGPEDLLPPERAALWPPLYERALSEGPFRAEYSLLDGRILEMSFNPILHDGRTTGFSVFGKDITERRTAEKTLRETESSYRSIFEGALEGIYRTSPDGRILAANPVMARMLGYDDELDLIQPIAVSAHQVWADPEERSQLLRLVEERGSVQGYECRFRRKDGSVIWVSLNCMKIAGPGGRTVSYQGFVEDISGRRRAEEKLKTSENKFRMAFMTGADAFSISTLKEGLILDINDRYTEVFGYTAEEVRGRTSNDLGVYAASDRDRLLAELRTRGCAIEMEFLARRKNGELRSVLVSANSIQGEDEDLLLTVVRDITEQRRAEAERIKLEERFRQAQKLESIGRLAGGVAHDFNNLLTVINGYGNLLLQECRQGDPLREWVEEICQAGERATNLTGQLLAISRKQIAKPKPVCLHRLVTESQSMLRRLIGEDIELLIPADASAGTIMADPGQLHQVLMNLVVNARDAMSHGGKLTIRTASVEGAEAGAEGNPDMAPGPYVSLSISDTGVGIAKEIQERIFDPFFTTKGEGEGTGLGLSTVYGIVRQLGGSIVVRSEPGHGTTFEICLPRLQDSVAVAAEDARMKTPARGSETVLVVEDQEPVRHFTVTVLKERGYRVLQAAHGGDALQVAEGHSGPIHLLLTDVVMPHMTGKELADRLRPLRPEMKVLYMSGYTAEIIARRELLETETSYLAKPFAPDALAAKVREALGSPRLAAAILVVDDDGAVRAFFQQVLAGAGYEVVAACDGAEALKRARRQRFDLLLTDLVMPEREGLEIIGILRKECPELKIVAVSGAFGGTFLKTAQLLGADSTLLKPVSPDRLLAAVQAAFGVRKEQIRPMTCRRQPAGRSSLPAFPTFLTEIGVMI